MLSRTLQPKSAQCLKYCARNMGAKSSKTPGASKLLNTNTRVKKPFVKQVRNNDIKRYNHTLTSENTMKKESPKKVESYFNEAQLRKLAPYQLAFSIIATAFLITVEYQQNKVIENHIKFKPLDKLNYEHISSLLAESKSFQLSDVTSPYMSRVAHWLEKEIKHKNGGSCKNYSKERIYPTILCCALLGISPFLGGLPASALFAGNIYVGSTMLYFGIQNIVTSKCKSQNDYDIQKSWISNKVTVSHIDKRK